MYIYNVTIKIQPADKEEWLSFMLYEHIPEILDTQLFSDYRLCHLLDQNEEDGITFVVQYYFNEFENYSNYRQNFAPSIQKKHTEKFKERFVAFRTVMEVELSYSLIKI
jgi:hypothetical protein